MANQRGIPEWPDFEVELCGPLWFARTDTGRPVTPIFSRVLPIPPSASEERARERGREMLDHAYQGAHPNGCPKRHEGNHEHS